MAVISDGNRIGTDGDGSTDIPEGQNDYAERNLVSANDGPGSALASMSGPPTTSSPAISSAPMPRGPHSLGNNSRRRHPSPAITTGSASMAMTQTPQQSGTSFRVTPSLASVLAWGGGQNVVAGNFIGTDAPGPSPWAMAGTGTAGVVILQSDGNLIGTDGDGVGDASERNIISANQGDGVDIHRAATTTSWPATSSAPTSPGLSRSATLEPASTSVRQQLEPDRHRRTERGQRRRGERHLVQRRAASTSARGAPGQDNLIAGNFVGTDCNGHPIPGATPGSGIDVEGDSNDQIGGSPALANTIANVHGVTVTGARPESRSGPI